MKDQLHRIKSLMGLVKEQKKDNLQQQTQLPSDYLGKGGSFERQLYDGTSENYYKRYLYGIPPTRIKKVRLVFPLENWELLVYLAKAFQIVTGVFRNLGQALKFVSYLSEKNVVTDELVVGSHGYAETLLMTKEEGSFRFNNNFLLDLKKIVDSNTTIFFTACSGADYLDTLKNAAEKLEVGVYGSAGLYNYVTNTSERGFYWCSPKEFQIPYSNKKIEQIIYSKNGVVSLLLNVNLVEKEKFDYYITIKSGVFGKSEVKFKNSPVGQAIRDFKSGSSLMLPRRGVSIGGNVFTLGKYDIYVKNEIEKYFKNYQVKNKSNPYNDKLKQLSNQSIDDYIIEKIKSNQIIIEVQLRNKLDNIKSFTGYRLPENITNEYLLENNLCKKVPSSPISWLNIGELGL